MKYRIPLVLIPLLSIACQSLQNEGLKSSADRPLGAKSRKPFDDMISQARQQKNRLGSIHFANDSSALTDSEKQTLDRMGEIIASRSGPTMVEGHTDNTHPGLDNRRLGYLRAIAVAEYLKGAGVWDERIVVRCFGENRPASTNWNEEGKKENNRVDIKMLAQGEGISGKESALIYTKMISRMKPKSSTNRSSVLDPALASLKSNEPEKQENPQK